jgi:hypothetical protein
MEAEKLTNSAPLALTYVLDRRSHSGGYLVKTAMGSQQFSVECPGASATAPVQFSVRHWTNLEEFSTGEIPCPFTSRAVVSPQTQSRA